jgi:hypothetical protein
MHLEIQQNSVVVDNQAQHAQAVDNGVENTALLALFSLDLDGGIGVNNATIELAQSLLNPDIPFTSVNEVSLTGTATLTVGQTRTASGQGHYGAV